MRKALVLLCFLAGTCTMLVAQKNVALNKPTIQSSEAYGGQSSRAVDGNTNQNYGGRSVTHTNKEQNPWWEVDLGAVHKISQIVIWNRADCCSGRLNTMRIYAKETKNERGQLYGDAGNYRYVPGSEATPIKYKGQTKARYVRVQLGSNDYLSLAEVQVFGAPVNGIAQNQARVDEPITDLELVISATINENGRSSGEPGSENEIYGSVTFQNTSAQRAWTLWSADKGSPQNTRRSMSTSGVSFKNP